jgi:hypothetical protein
MMVAQLSCSSTPRSSAPLGMALLLVADAVRPGIIVNAGPSGLLFDAAAFGYLSSEAGVAGMTCSKVPPV